MRSPSAEHLQSTFVVLPYRYEADWDERAKVGKLGLVEFPDKSRLYLNTVMNNDNQNYIAEAFWDQRWQQYWQVASPYVYGGVGPPIALLLLGSFLVWVGREFARDMPRVG